MPTETDLADPRVPQPGRYAEYGVPPAIAERVERIRANLRDPNARVMDGFVESSVAEILRLLAPWTRPASGP